MKGPTIPVQRPAKAASQRTPTVAASTTAQTSLSGRRGSSVGVTTARTPRSGRNPVTSVTAASPPQSSRRRLGSADSSNNGAGASHSPKRPELTSFMAPRSPNASARKSPVPSGGLASPVQAHASASSASGASAPGTGRAGAAAAGTAVPSTPPSWLRAQHIPAWASDTPPRTATATAAIADVPASLTISRGGPASAPTRDGSAEPRAVQRSTTTRISPSRSPTPQVAAGGSAPAAAERGQLLLIVHSMPAAASPASSGGQSPPSLIPSKSVFQLPVVSATISRLQLPTLGHSPANDASRKSSVWSSEQTNRSAILAASADTLAPSYLSHRNSWVDEAELDEDVATSAGTPLPPQAPSPSLTPVATSTGRAQTSQSSTAPKRSTPRAAAAAAASPTKRRTSAEALPTKVGTPRNARGAPAAAAPEERTPTPRTAPQTNKVTEPNRGGTPSPAAAAAAAVTGAAASGALASPPSTPQKPPAPVLTTATPTRGPASPATADRTAPSRTRAAAPGSGGTGDTPRQSPSPRGAGSAPMSGVSHPPAAPPSSAAAAAPPPAPASAAHSQRAAAVLSQTLSVVRPMAPVVHVRIRPVLPTVGESSNRRHVYFLDHENVMVTRARPGGTSTTAPPGNAGAGASAVTLPASMPDFSSTRRHGAAVLLHFNALDPLSHSGAAMGRGRERGFASSSSLMNAVLTSDAPTVAAAAGVHKVPVSALTSQPPANLYTSDLTLPHAQSTHTAASQDSPPAAAKAAAPEGHRSTTADVPVVHVVSALTTPGSTKLQPLSITAHPPPPLMMPHHMRTYSWTSQGSEEHSPCSRLSGGSPSALISPQQPGLSMNATAPPVFSLGPSTSATRARPSLVTFAPYAEDNVTVSQTTTPREPRAGSNSTAGASAASVSAATAVGKPAAAAAAAASASASSGQQQRRLKGSQGVERRPRYTAATGSPGTPSAAKSGASRASSAAAPAASGNGSAVRTAPATLLSPTGTRRRASRSVLGASVSVSAMSIPAIPRTGAAAGTAGGAGPRTGGEDAEGGGRTPHAAAALPRQQTPLGASNALNSSSVSPPGPAAGVGAEQHYSFEFVHDEEATQADVFEESVLRFADEALLAQNVAIICYGPTGSGKTYSMMGSQIPAPHATPSHTTPPANGATSVRGGGAERTPRGGTGHGHGASPPHARGGRTPHHRSGAAEGRRRLFEDAGADDRDGHAAGGAGEDEESDGASWLQLGSSWQYGYRGHSAKSSRLPAIPQPLSPHQHSGAASTTSAAAEATSPPQPPRGAKPAAESDLDAALASAGGMTEIGILPRLVHTLLERRGETITIRRDPGREAVLRAGGGGSGGGGGGSANASVNGASAPAAGAAAAQPPRPTPVTKRPGGLSLTLRDLTFYGIELYMDELCDLLDPGKRPIQIVSDTGGLAALCQRINEARDYRIITGGRGGVSHRAAPSWRTGGGIPITSLPDLRKAYKLAHSNRVTSRHAQNDTSSRSHAIFLLQLDFDLVEWTDTLQANGAAGVVGATSASNFSATGGGAGEHEASASVAPSEHVQRVQSFVAMVDLAGCERVKQTKVEGAALREAQYINKSLSALSSVVLSLHRNNAHVPYRDSKLTRLLRPCLEGGRVLTLVHVAPCSSTETVNTLTFADQIRHTHIPTHALTPTTSKHRELLDVFADLIDPMQGQWEAQVRATQVQLNRLCADLRLSYFTRAIGAVPRRAASRVSIASDDVVSELSAMSDADNDVASISPGDVSLEEGPPPLPDDATAAERRRYALHAMVHRMMGPIQTHQRTAMREAVRAIRHRKDAHVQASHERHQRRIDEMQAALQTLTEVNATLAKENSTPLPRDPHALQLSRRIRESTEELGECAREQAALATLTTALRQRVAAQDDLEAAVDEQLHNVQQRTAQAMRTVSAAVAAHPPGGPPPSGSNPASSREPTLPTGSPTATSVIADTSDDPELRDIAHQQLSLAKELAALRLETACFEMGTGLWEGLWARAMRKEVVTAMEVEAFAMERILLDRRALSMMMWTDDAGDEEEEDEAAAGDVVALAAAADLDDAFGVAPLPQAPLQRPAHLAQPLRVTDGEGRGVGGSGGRSVSDRSRSSSQHPSVSSTPRAALRARLGSYLYGGGGLESSGEGGSGMVTPRGSATASAAGTAAEPLSPATPLPRTHRDAAAGDFAAAVSDRSPGAGDNVRVRGNGAGGAAPSAASVSVPNPLTALTARGGGGGGRAANGALPTPGIAAALAPLSLHGAYEEEQALQEASLQLLLRDGVACEVCCIGESAHHTLQHYILPQTADAPLADEVEPDEATTSAAAPRYCVSAAAAAAAAASREAGSPAHHGASHKSGKGSAVNTPNPTPRGRTASASAASGGGARTTGGAAAHEHGEAKRPVCCTTRSGRLRLVRMPRRPNAYVLEFVYTHQGLPLPPRLQAAMLGKPEELFTCVPGKTNLEQMVDALPSVQGVAGRGGGNSASSGGNNNGSGGGSGGGGGGGGGAGAGGGAGGGGGGSGGGRPQGPMREHRLFAIPLYEPTLHLHLDVLEEGIAHMTTPVAAAVAPPPCGSDGPAPAGSTFENAAGSLLSASPSTASAGGPALCVARRAEPGTQLVLEVRGIPKAASSRRPVLPTSAESKKTPRSSDAQQQLQRRHHAHPHVHHALQKGSPRIDPAGAGFGLQSLQSSFGELQRYESLTGSPSRPGAPAQAAAGAASASMSPPPQPATTGTAAGAAAWSDLVLAKRLGSGGELMLPSSCILANTGCCSLVLRFPAPFFTGSGAGAAAGAAAAHAESVEAVVAALCGILRPVMSAPEMRTSPSAVSPSNRRGSSSGGGATSGSASARRRLSVSPRSASGGGAVERASGGGGHTGSAGAAGGGRRRSSVSRSPVQGARSPVGLEVVHYVHVPYVMFAAAAAAAAASTPPNRPRAATLSPNGASLGGNGVQAASRSGRASSGSAAASLASSVARSDSLDALGAMGGGLLGHALQSSCSPAHGRHGAATTPPLDLHLQRSPPHAASPYLYAYSSVGRRQHRGDGPLGLSPASLVEQQSGATLQVQFHWVPTPRGVEPARVAASRKSSAGVSTSRAVADEGSGGGGGPFTVSLDLTVVLRRTAEDEQVRPQVQVALSVLAQLSYVSLEGRPPHEDGGRSASNSSSAAGGSAAHRTTLVPYTEPVRRRSRAESDAARFTDAVAVAALLRQLETYRHRIRRLFRQQLYDAEDVNGDDMTPSAPPAWLPSELGRGTYLRDVQSEVRSTVGLPASTVLGSAVGFGSPSQASQGSRAPEEVGGAAALEAEGGDNAPDAHVSVAEAREACAAVVPWTVWQWAYRWGQLQRLLRGDVPPPPGCGAAPDTGAQASVVSQAEAAAAWLPVGAPSSPGNPGTGHTLFVSQLAASSPLKASFNRAPSRAAESSSTSSDEAYVMEGDWLTEARLAARSKRVWLPDVMASSVPSYLEGCASAGQ